MSVCTHEMSKKASKWLNFCTESNWAETKTLNKPVLPVKHIFTIKMFLLLSSKFFPFTFHGKFSELWLTTYVWPVWLIDSFLTQYTGWWMLTWANCPPANGDHFAQTTLWKVLPLTVLIFSIRIHSQTGWRNTINHIIYIFTASALL